MDSTLSRRAAAQTAEAARTRSDEQRAYLDRVRAALARLSTPDIRPGDVRAALAVVESRAGIDPDPPTLSRRFTARLARHAFRRLTGWDLRYLGAQVTVLGYAIVGFGTAVVERTERLEATTGRVDDDVTALAARLERLEQQIAGR